MIISMSGDCLVTEIPELIASSGSLGWAFCTRLLMSTLARSMLVPTSKVTWRT